MVLLSPVWKKFFLVPWCYSVFRFVIVFCTSASVFLSLYWVFLFPFLWIFFYFHLALSLYFLLQKNTVLLNSLLILYFIHVSPLWPYFLCSDFPLVCVSLQFCLLVSLCLTSSVSVSLLVFFWKITRSGAVRVHVFCAGCTDWMGWLHRAGFLCGPRQTLWFIQLKAEEHDPQWPQRESCTWV